MVKIVLSRDQEDLALENTRDTIRTLQKALNEAKKRLNRLEDAKSRHDGGKVTQRRTPPSATSRPDQHSVREPKNQGPSYARPTHSSTRKTATSPESTRQTVASHVAATPLHGNRQGYRGGRLVDLKHHQQPTTSFREKNPNLWQWGSESPVIIFPYRPKQKNDEDKAEKSSNPEEQQIFKDDTDSWRDQEDLAFEYDDSVDEIRKIIGLKTRLGKDFLADGLRKLHVPGIPAFRLLEEALQTCKEAIWHLLDREFGSDRRNYFPEGPYQVKFGREEIMDNWMYSDTWYKGRRLDNIMLMVVRLRNRVCHPTGLAENAEFYDDYLRQAHRLCVEVEDEARAQRICDSRVKLCTTAQVPLKEITGLMFLAELPFAYEYSSEVQRVLGHMWHRCLYECEWGQYINAYCEHPTSDSDCLPGETALAQAALQWQQMWMTREKDIRNREDWTPFDHVGEEL